MGQPQSVRRKILGGLPVCGQAGVSSLTLYAVQRGYLIWQQWDLPSGHGDFDTVRRAVGPRAAVWFDGDDICAELRSVSMIAPEEVAG